MLSKILGLLLVLTMMPALAVTDAEFVDLSGKKLNYRITVESGLL